MWGLYLLKLSSRDLLLINYYYSFNPNPPHLCSPKTTVGIISDVDSLTSRISEDSNSLVSPALDLHLHGNAFVFVLLI